MRRLRGVGLSSALLLAAAAAAYYGVPGHRALTLRPRPTPMASGVAATPTPSAPASPPPLATDQWLLSNPSGLTQGFASATSVDPGGSVDLFVSTRSVSWWAAIYRMGWFSGLGGELMEAVPPQPGVDQGGSTRPDPQTGLVRAPWQPSYHLDVPPDWPTGMYMIKLIDSGGGQSYIPLVVRGHGAAPIVLVHSSATEQAYNSWGFNQSLYTGSTPALKLSRAVKVSFDRPFTRDYGAGEFFFWEYQMVRFLDRSGIPVDYLTDVDVHEHPEWLQRYQAVVVVGHDEYWSKPMRDGYLAAVAHGVSLGVFGGNAAYRQVRFEPSSVGPDRVEVCYKDTALDPEGDPALKTAVSWRSAPTSWDESNLLGATWVGTGEEVHREPWVVTDASSWVFAGSGLRNGDSLPGLVGYEQDHFDPSAPHPRGVTVLSSSPVPTSSGTVLANSTVYIAPSGAVVFDAGTIEWSWGLDHFVTPTTGTGLRQYFVSDRRPDYYSGPAQVVTLNLLRRMLGA